MLSAVQLQTPADVLHVKPASVPGLHSEVALHRVQVCVAVSQPVSGLALQSASAVHSTQDPPLQCGAVLPQFPSEVHLEQLLVVVSQ